MSLTVVGSVAFDAVQTPFGSRERMLGGAAVYSSLAASFFTDVNLIGVVGDDFGPDELAVLETRSINTDGLERVPGGETFFWRGSYDFDLNVAHTHETRLNVFAEFEPKLTDAARAADALFLANIQPGLQRRVREQCPDVALSALDSMNLWIETARDELIRTIGLVDVLLLNDAEARQLTSEPNLARAARAIASWGPRYLVAKQGEYGAALFTPDGFFSVPAYPLEDVLDPTGAGDSFAGGFVGFLAAHAAAGAALGDDLLRSAMVYGSVLASFNVESFGTERLQALTRGEIEQRFDEFVRMTRFEPQPVADR